MRVPNLSLYSNTRYQLNSITNNLNNANEVMATQKQINSIADDPIGLSQVLDIESSVNSLEQFNKNIDMGTTWLNGAESAIRSVSDQLLEAKTLSIQLANASASATERANAVESIEGIIEQIMSLGNTQINGSYIFGGTNTDTRPFAYDDEDNPTQVVYSGNDSPFTIKTNDVSSLAVGRDGNEVFTEERILVDSTNNKLFFREDPGLGENSKIVLEATLPDGEYTPEELAVAARNAMNHASEDKGYGISYTVSYDDTTKQFSIANDGSYPGYMGFDLLWESGETPRVGSVTTENILLEGVDVDVINGDALAYETPEPDGTAPLRLTWDGDGNWKILNDPGYGLPLQVSGTDSMVELDLTDDGIPDIRVTMESPAQTGGYVEFDISAASEEHSIGPDMGFVSGDVSYTPPQSDSEVALKTFDATNNVIDFQEVVGVGPWPQLSAVIPKGEYSDMDELATAIETAMEGSSVNNADYEVTYDDNANTFIIENLSGLTELRLLWNSGTNSVKSAASELGFNVADDTGATSYTSDNQVAMFTVNTGVNDSINFKELLAGSDWDDIDELTATIAAGTYYDPESFARAVEDALEDASEQNGNRVDYDVTYSYNTRKFSIEEDGTLGRKLEDLALLWGTGDDMATNAADIMGFNKTDVTSTPPEGDPVTWGVFETLFDLKEYLASDDVDGIQRTITRLDNHFDSITSVLSDIGMKNNRLLTIQQVSSETTSSLTERKSMIEDADFTEAVMNLTAIQTAYEASLSSTAKIINISLVEYL